MKNRQLLYLFLSQLIVLFVGMGLFPLLPLYATEFGASPTMVGIYFALMYVSNAAGTILAGRAARRLSRKGAFVAATALGIPALALLGEARALWQVILLTGLLWFSGGMANTLASVFTGLHADSKQRGTSFSVMFLAFPLGALFGGTTIGRLVADYGYQMMFLALAVLWTALPAIGLLAIRDKVVQKPGATAAATAAAAPVMGRTFYLLLLVSLLSSMTISAGRLGTSVSMQALQFSAGAISSTATISGLITIPVALLFGALSDRLGRERFLRLAYGLAGGGALVLMGATQLWHFWLAATLLMVALCASGAMVSALATDALPPEALSQGLPWVKGMGSLAGIISFASTGYVIENFGSTALYAAAAFLAFAAILSLVSLQQACQEAPQPAPEHRGWQELFRWLRSAPAAC